MLLLVAFLYIVFLQIVAYNDLITTKFRFRFFALRDRLALLVCDGSLKEDSWEYKYVIDALNYHISAVERLSITDVIEAFVNFHTSSDENKAFKRLQKTVDHEDVKEILDEYMLTVLQMIKRNSKWQIRFVILASAVINKLKLSPSEEAKATVVNPGPALTAITAHRNALHSNPSFG